MVKSLKKICGYAIFSLFMVLTVRWWLDGFKPTKEPENIIGLMLELESKDLNGVKEVLGEPKSVHRNKVYTYKDSLGAYDILIDKEVESIVISFDDKVSMSEQQVISEIGIREDITDKKVTEKEGIKSTVIYNLGKITKLEIHSGEKDKNINIVKITY